MAHLKRKNSVRTIVIEMPITAHNKIQLFSFNREVISELTFEILALDSGTPRLTGTGTLRVIVEDVNDDEPTFENDVYFFTSEENVDIGTTIDKVFAFDNDFGLNSKIRYVL